MQRVPVVSSDLASVGYDANSQTLEIEFRTGAVYEYRPVAPALHAELMSAPSLGRFFNQRIRNAGFVCTKLR